MSAIDPSAQDSRCDTDKGLSSAYPWEGKRAGFYITTRSDARMEINRLSTELQFNRLSLAFKGRHDHLEPIFLDHYFLSTINQTRIAVATAGIFFAVFAIMDKMVVPDGYATFWLIRWAIICPTVLVVFLVSISRHARRLTQPAVCLGTTVGGMGIIAMILLAAHQSNHSYVGGLVQIIFFIFTFIRLRFIWATGAAWALILTYLILAASTGIIPQKQLVGSGFHLALICVMGMMVGYAIEYQTRKNFFLSRHLESKKRRLAISNQFLEERVGKRTRELSRANKLLKSEICERKSIEDALRDNQERYLRMVDNVSDYIFVHNMQGNILEANRQMREGLGYTTEELETLNHKNLLVPEERSGFVDYIEDLRHNTTAVGQMTLLTKNGQRRQFEYSNVLADFNGRRQAVFCLARDVTEQYITRKALAESQAHFKTIFNTAAAGMVIVNGQDDKVLEINPAAAHMAGLTSEVLKASSLESLLVPVHENDGRRLRMPTPHPIECRLIRKNKDPLPVLASTRSTGRDAKSHWIVSFVNIQKIKEAEATKRDLEIRSSHAQHLESIGTLAGGIAHDFNNILFGMIGFTELALDDAPGESLLASNLQEILRGGARAKEMIAQILTFSRQESVSKHPIHPTPLIKEAFKLLRASIPATTDIKLNFKSDVDMINANPTHIHQLVMNLCTNASHAIGQNPGRIQLALSNQSLSNDIETTQGSLPKGDYVQLVVQDDGNGIDPQIAERIFEPFFTTKAQGKGTGMGLSVVHGIVQAHGGIIRVTSQIDKGSRFEILLPAVQGTVAPSVPDGDMVQGGTERILFVDDESALVLMVDRTLSGLGYDVTTCQNPVEALDLVRQNPQRYDAVITDLTMPAMNGLQLAQRLLDLRPDLPILLCTGYGDQISQEMIRKEGIRELMLKPVSKREMAMVIRKALDMN